MFLVCNHTGRMHFAIWPSVTLLFKENSISTTQNTSSNCSIEFYSTGKPGKTTFNKHSSILHDTQYSLFLHKDHTVHKSYYVGHITAIIKNMG